MYLQTKPPGYDETLSSHTPPLFLLQHSTSLSMKPVFSNMFVFMMMAGLVVVASHDNDPSVRTDMIIF
jgi:hypothetical protein